MNIRRFARTPLVTLFGILASALSQQLVHAADPAKDADALVPNKTQIAQLQRLAKSLDDRITAGFRGQEKLKDEMTAQLKAIAAMKNAAERNRALSAYQAKYKQGYAGVLAKSNVDLNVVAGQLRGIFPHHAFRVARDLAIVGTYKDKAFTSPTPLPPADKTEKVPASDFETQKEKSCGLAAGGDVTSSSDSIKATALAAVAGGCSNRGRMSAVVRLPAERTSANIRAEADLAADGFAVGVVGTAVASAGAGFHVVCGGASSSADVSIFIVAPILWAGSAEEELDGASREVVVPASVAECTVSTRSNAIVVSFLGESHSTGESDNFEALVTIEY